MLFTLIIILFCSCSWSPVPPQGLMPTRTWIRLRWTLSGEIPQLHSLRERGGGGRAERCFGGRPLGNTERRSRKTVRHHEYHTHSELTFTRATRSVLIGFVDSRRAGQHRAPVSLPLQEDGAEAEEEGCMLENKNNPEMERDDRLRTRKCFGEPSRAGWAIMIFTTVTVVFKGISLISIHYYWYCVKSYCQCLFYASCFILWCTLSCNEKC